MTEMDVKMEAVMEVEGQDWRDRGVMQQLSRQTWLTRLVSAAWS